MNTDLVLVIVKTGKYSGSSPCDLYVMPLAVVDEDGVHDDHVLVVCVVQIAANNLPIINKTSEINSR